ncbi:MAG: JAB domain-containing protein [Flavobacterium sp.]|nr:JAB domain-containing protein [Flavobacterium sp.]
MVAHNHPSGNDKFSDADKKLTTKLVGVGRMLDLPILDHLVITKHGYSSFTDNGLIVNSSAPVLSPECCTYVVPYEKRLTEFICQPLSLLVARTGVEPVTSGL